MPCHSQSEPNDVLDIALEELQEVQLHIDRDLHALTRRDLPRIVHDARDRLDTIEHQDPVHSGEARGNAVLRRIFRSHIHCELKRYLTKGYGSADPRETSRPDVLVARRLVQRNARQPGLIDAVDGKLHLPEGQGLLDRGAAGHADGREQEDQQDCAVAHRLLGMLRFSGRFFPIPCHPEPRMRKLHPHEISRPTPRELSRLARAPLAVILDDIRSAHNVGSILRTADAVRASEVYCCGYTPAPEHPSVRKTALGAEETVPWTVISDAVEAIDLLRQRGYRVVALEQTDDPTPLAELSPQDFPLALVLGNEVTGVQQRVLDACDFAIELPQYGAKLSLNVAVAFGIAAYALVARSEREGSLNAHRTDL